MQQDRTTVEEIAAFAEDGGDLAGEAIDRLKTATGITRPIRVFDGSSGFNHLARQQAKVDWLHKSFDIPLGISIKRYNAEV